jgi:hypothetical protein
LQKLFCSFNQISGLEPLRELKDLQQLFCPINEIGSLEIEKFKKEHPNCVVIG